MTEKEMKRLSRRQLLQLLLEQTERADLIAQVDTYAKEMMIKFITGAEPLENFEAYVEEVNEYGLTEAIEITQGALDRFLGK